MKLSNINSSQAFGKQALMTCKVRESNINLEHDATLYKLNPENNKDRDDVLLSKNTVCIKRDFDKARYTMYPQKDFYLLRNNYNKEVISCAEVSNHYKQTQDYSPVEYTLIEDASENKKYKNGINPILTYLTKLAEKKQKDAIYTAFDENTVIGLKESELSKIDTGEFCITKEKFKNALKSAEDEYEIEYIKHEIR